MNNYHNHIYNDPEGIRDNDPVIINLENSKQ